MLRYRPSLASGLATLATAVALASAWHSGRHMWHLLQHEFDGYRTYTASERRNAPFEAINLPGNVFDFYADRVGRGDRVYFQTHRGRLGTSVNLPTGFRYAGRFALLPALQADGLGDATVVVTFYDDPKRLRAHYLTQEQAGEQPIYVSRIREP